MNPFGPLFVFELARVTRRQRPITGRCLYVLLLLVLLGFVYLSLFPRGPQSIGDFLFRSTVRPRDVANFGSIFFVVFAVVQYAVGVLVTASSTAAILAEEKERQTLPFLLTTTLSDREIVLGKLAARVAQVLMVLLAGLPALAAVQVMGGIDPVMLAAAFIATGAGVISAAGLAAAISVAAPNVKTATGRAVGLIAGYTAGVPLVSGYLLRAYGHGPLPLAGWFVADLIDWANAGNMFWGMTTIGRKMGATVSFDAVLIPVLGKFLAFHLLIAVVCGGWAALRLRAVLRGQADRAAQKATRGPGLMAPRGRRPVSQLYPVYWRETTTAIGKTGERAWVRWAKRLAFVACFIPLGLALVEGMNRGRLGSEIHNVVRGLGTIAVCTSLLHMANAAGTMIGRERRQKTIDELFLTDLSNREILLQKSLAAIWSARWFLVLIGIHWAVAFATRALSPLAVPFVLPVYWVYMLLCVRLGIALSAFETPRFKAPQAATLGLILIAGLPWILPIGHAILIDAPGRHVEYTAMFAAGLSPPAALGFLTVAPETGDNPWDGRAAMIAVFVVGLGIGLTLSVVFSNYLWRQTRARLALMRRE
jgi:ABC-type Na+ efflux pump permease subunit